MSAAAHTPGPWNWWPHSTAANGLMGADQKRILWALDGSPDDGLRTWDEQSTIEIRSKEDAGLIVAAPELLAALHPLMMAANAQVDWWKQEALRLRNIGAHDGSAQEIAARWFKLFKDADAAISKANGPRK